MSHWALRARGEVTLLGGYVHVSATSSSPAPKLLDQSAETAELSHPMACLPCWTSCSARKDIVSFVLTSVSPELLRMPGRCQVPSQYLLEEGLSEWKIAG